MRLALFGLLALATAGGLLRGWDVAILALGLGLAIGGVPLLLDLLIAPA
jgi:hypothetical protein